MATPAIIESYSVLRNISGKRMFLAFVGPHGAVLEIGQDVAVPGDIWVNVSSAKYNRVFKALKYCLTNGLIEVLQTPSVMTYDTADSTLKKLVATSGSPVLATRLMVRTRARQSRCNRRRKSKANGDRRGLFHYAQVRYVRRPSPSYRSRMYGLHPHLAVPCGDSLCCAIHCGCRISAGGSCKYASLSVRWGRLRVQIVRSECVTHRLLVCRQVTFLGFNNLEVGNVAAFEKLEEERSACFCTLR